MWGGGNHELLSKNNYVPSHYCKIVVRYYEILTHINKYYVISLSVSPPFFFLLNRCLTARKWASMQYNYRTSLLFRQAQLLCICFRFKRKRGPHSAVVLQEQKRRDFQCFFVCLNHVWKSRWAYVCWNLRKIIGKKPSYFHLDLVHSQTRKLTAQWNLRKKINKLFFLFQ